MQHLINELKTLISCGVKKHPLPVKVGNSIRIGPVVIRQLKDKSFILFDSKKQEQIGSVYSKHSALAIAKLYNENEKINYILVLDQKIQKHELDARFYQHTIDKTKDDHKKDVLDIRLSVAYDELRAINNKLEQIIFY
jgi:hypothetical protein